MRARNARGGPYVCSGVTARILAAALLLAVGCSKRPRDSEPAGAEQAAPAQAPTQPGADCPQSPIAKTVAPDVADRHRDPETWLAMLPPGEADRVLVDPERLTGLNATFAEVPGAFRDPLSDEVADPEKVAAEIEERRVFMRSQVDGAHYVEGEAGALAASEQVTASAQAVDEVRLVVEEAPLWCVPLDSGLYKPPIDPSFDRNRCASLHAGELVRVLRRTADSEEGSEEGSDDDSWLYVNAGHTTGWLHAPELTPHLPPEHVRPLWTGPTLVPTRDDITTEAGQTIRLGTRLPLRSQDEDGYTVLVPSAEGPTEARIPASAPVHVGPRPLTRRNLWTMAMTELDEPYGWGGTGGARDCSRYLRDLLVTFGIELARHSGVQAKLGTEQIDVAGMSDDAKRKAIADAAERGVVLLYMPGHIMMYLGRDGGRDYAVSAISEWLEPCEGGPDTVYRLDRVAVTTLELGRNTERTSYIERITTLVLFAPPAESSQSAESEVTPVGAAVPG